MLTLWGKRQTFCAGLSRRDFLQIGAFGAGLTLVDMLHARALAGTGSSSKSALATITLIVTRGPLAGQHYAFDKPTACVIGRADDCTISVPQDAEFAVVSRHHCRLDISPPAIHVRDLGSANGTFVNGRKIGQRDSGTEPGSAGQAGWPAIELSAGDEILLADHTAFRVSFSPPPDPGIWTGSTEVF
jgi:pSer/pThr/pTyr-binding forkhead associated (FHA) protein